METGSDNISSGAGVHLPGWGSLVRFDGSLTLDEKREELALVRGVELRNLELVFE